METKVEGTAIYHEQTRYAVVSISGIIHEGLFLAIRNDPDEQGVASDPGYIHLKPEQAWELVDNIINTLDADTDI